ncbi:MAG: PP2C family protein-serine/threonine phosphatase [Streptosporangiaceae bacterium]
MALILALAVIVIGLAAGEETRSWFSAGVLILPILAGGLLLWPRALRVVFALVAAVLCYNWIWGKAGPGPGITATILVTALFADILARTRAQLGILGLRGSHMLIELRDRIQAQGRMPQLPEGWHSVSLLKAAGGSSFGGDFLVSACDGKKLEVALADVAGKGIDAGTQALLLSGAFGGLLGSVPPDEFLSSCNAYLRRGYPGESFVTVVHVAVDLATGEYTISSAGHPPAAHFEAGNGRWRLSGARGIVLGVVPDLHSAPDHGSLQPGDALMLYTDGLVEVPGQDIDTGIERMLTEADRLLAGGFDLGAGKLMRTMRAVHAATDDCTLALIWRA